MSYAPSAPALKRIEGIISPYPERSAALLPVLHVIQEEAGHISREAEAWVAAKLGVQPLRVREVITFYTMLRRKPAGRTVIQVCRNLSCTMAGAEDIIGFLREKLQLGPGDTTADGRITLATVECLGNCDNAPCLQVDGTDYGRVTKDMAAALVQELENA
jgi:NADH-quinone oxidoreductase subunit E